MELIHTDLKLENILFVNSDWQYHRHSKHGRSRVVKQKDIVVIDLGSATYEQVGFNLAGFPDSCELVL
jgi:serine/threonine protein kinase